MAGAQNHVIKLWPDAIPLATTAHRTNNVVAPDGTGCIDNIHDPEMEVFLPEKGKGNGSAVLIFPGGGYSVVCVRKEGHVLATWLAGHGIAGIVLQYRLPLDSTTSDKSIAPLQDAQRAMRLVRENAGTWHIDPEKVGVMGFSAGGHLASTLSTHYNEKVYDGKENLSARPAFSILIYPVISFDETIAHMGSRRNLLGDSPSAKTVRHFSNELQVTGDTPPTFLVHATDDQSVVVQNSLRYYEALLKNKVPAELHIYQSGGHGFAMGTGGTENQWPEACLDWLKTLK